MFDRNHSGVRGWLSGGQARSAFLKSKNIGMHGQTAVASLRVLDTVLFVQTRRYSAAVAVPHGLHVLVYKVHVDPQYPDLILIRTPCQHLFIGLFLLTHPHPIVAQPTSSHCIAVPPHRRLSFSVHIFSRWSPCCWDRLVPTLSVSSIRSRNWPPVAFANR